MIFRTLILAAALLCAETPGGSLADSYLIVQTLLYRSEVSESSLWTIIHQPYQYQGLALVDWEAYLLYRREDMRENLGLVGYVLFFEKRVEVSHFCSVGSECSWEKDCQLVRGTEYHEFYLCEDWERKERESHKIDLTDIPVPFP